MSLQWHHNERLKSPALRLFTQPFIQGADQRKHQSFVSLAFMWGIHRWPVNSPHKRQVTRKMFPFDDVSMFVYKWFAIVILFWTSCRKVYQLSARLKTAISPLLTHWIYHSLAPGHRYSDIAVVPLTYLPLDTMAAILADNIFKCIFLNEKFCILTFTVVCSLVSNC